MKANTNVRARGLSAEEVLKSREQHGENLLTPPRRRSLWRLYLEKYEDPIVRILLVAAVISLGLAFVSGEFVETIGIILAVLFATTVGFYFERDAAKKFDVLTQLGEEQLVKVLREGRVQEIPRHEVVVGDVVIVETGDEVPADGRLFESNDLQVDESSLTGEMLTEKTPSYSPEGGEKTPPGLPEGEEKLAHEGGVDSLHTCAAWNSPPSGELEGVGGSAYPPNFLLRSSMVMSGSGRMVVTAVGDATEIGHVAREATELSAVKTPLNMQLDRLAKFISKVGSAVSIVAFLAFLTHDVLTQPLWHTDNYVGMAEVVLRYFMMAVTLIVMAVPEGLPMAVTLALALNMRRMLKSNNLVRKLQASETMGAVTVICTDKTGTLTENRMTVQELLVADDAEAEALFRQAVAINATAELNGEQGIGNPTEVALLRRLRQMGDSYVSLRANAQIVERIPFSTEKKYMQTTAVVDGVTHTFVKGAPEIVLAQCQMRDDAERELVQSRLLEWQQKAMRTLAFVCDGRFQAIVGISDPVRHDVPKAVADCRRAGIEVKVVTGDTQATALEIARQIGLDVEAPDSHITGVDFATLSDEEARQRVQRLKVMSRARPADKQRLVQLLQELGEVVAVTGDGTNDAPALNHAHVGLSLGSGTSVAKEASDITLLDDSFHSVVRAVEWGRSLYKNIQRFIFFQLVVNVTALLLVIGGSIIGTQMPLTVTQILWVNLIMDTFAAMALASLPPSHEVLNDAPRKTSDSIISRSMLRGIVGLGSLFFLATFVYLYWLEHNADGTGGVNSYELTQFFTVFVMIQWWNLFNARTLHSNHSAFHHFFWGKGFVLVLVLILLGQVAIVEWGGTMFRTEHLSLMDWVRIILFTMPVMLLGELHQVYKRIRKK